MSVGLYLLGRLGTAQLEPNTFLQSIGKWIAHNCAELEPTMRRGFIDEKPCLFASLHPAAEEVEICMLDPNQLTVSANTSTVGPAYHIYLCEMLHSWTTQFSIGWQHFGPDEDATFEDETEYFFTRDKSAVYKQMGKWLKTLTGCFFDGTHDSDAKNNALCMPMNTQFQTDSFAITQLGPRDESWLRQMSEGLIPQSEFFSWFNVGLTAEYHLGRALVQMWSNVRWREPINDGEWRTLNSTLRSLETAYRIKPELNMPWNEWGELVRLTGSSPPAFLSTRISGPSEIGYRRGRVRVSLPGYWSIEIEGSFSEFESQEDGSLSSFDPPREIWFTAYSFSADDPDKTFGTMRKHALADSPELVHEDDHYISMARIYEKDGQHILQSTNIGVLCRSICTIVFDNDYDREWAIRAWKSLRPPARVKRDENS